MRPFAQREIVLASRLGPSFDLDFLSPNLAALVGVTRNSLESYFDSTGARQDAAINISPQDFDPSTLIVRGRPIWEQSTNTIRNPRCEGAVAGTPGTMPTHWASSTGVGITRELVGTGTENGIPYIDYRFTGTGAVVSDTQFEQAIFIGALSGQTWTHSSCFKIVSGSLTNVTVTQILGEYTAAGAFLAASTQNITPTGAALGGQRFSLSRALNNASTAYTTAAVRVQSTGAIDITLRIGGPQLEQKPVATPLILPPVGVPAQSTRAADSLVISDLAGIGFNPLEGTLVINLRWGAIATGTFPGVGFRGAGLEAIGFFANQATGQAVALVRDAAATSQAQMTIQGSGVAAGARSSLALVYGANNFAGCANGGTVLTDVAGSVPTVTQLRFHQLDNAVNSWLERARYWPRRLSGAEIQAVSTL